MDTNIFRCGDAFELLSGLPDGSIDMILTDPPYGATDCDWDTGALDYGLMMDEFRRVLRVGGNCLVMGTVPWFAHLVVRNIDWFKHDLVWDKVSPTGPWYAKYRPMGRHEMIGVFGRKGKCYYDPFIEERPVPIERSYRVGSTKVAKNFGNYKRQTNISTHVFPTTILKYSKRRARNLHSVAKPVELMERLIRMYCPEGGVVLDPFCGSGPVGAACVNAGRKFILNDLSQEYVDFARSQVDALLGVELCGVI